MHLTLERDGGLVAAPGLVGPIRVDTDLLSPDEATRWHGLVHDADPWSAAPASGSLAGADRRSYALLVEDGTRRVQLALQDPLPSKLRPLIRALEAHGRTQK